MDIPSLITELVQDHEWLRAAATDLDADLERIRPPKRFTDLWRALVEELTEHLDAEDKVLFPSLLDTVSGKHAWPLAGPGAAAQNSHAELLDLMQALRALSHLAGAHEDELVALLDRLTDHHDIEEERLLPAVAAHAGPVTG